MIRLNEEFKGCISEEDYNEQLELTVDPAFLAKSDTVQTLSFDDTIVIPDDVKNYLGNWFESIYLLWNILPTFFKRLST